MRVKTSYFALLRDRTGKNEEEIDTDAKTASELYQELDKRYGFNLPIDRIRFAINDNFSEPHSALSAEDHVIFIVPVSGG